MPKTELVFAQMLGTGAQVPFGWMKFFWCAEAPCGCSLGDWRFGPMRQQYAQVVAQSDATDIGVLHQPAHSGTNVGFVVVPKGTLGVIAGERADFSPIGRLDA